MKKSLVLVAVIWLAAGLAATALERDASMVDSIGVLAMPGEGSDGLSGTLWGETVLFGSEGEWTFLLGGQYGGVNPHEIDDVDFWSAGIGLKWYAFPLTSLAVKGEFGAYDLEGDPEVRTGTVELKQRLAPSDAPVVPSIVASGALRSADDFSLWRDNRITDYDDVSSEVVVALGAGLDVAMTADMVIGLQAVYTEAEELYDGWLVSAAMTYYWE